MTMDRRTFLGVAAASLADAQAKTVPIIDTHIHLFDPTRPQGVPWPPKDDPILYKPALPDRYRKIAVPLGVVGAIEVECSPWVEDNQWVLDVAAKDSIVVGTDRRPGARQAGVSRRSWRGFIKIRCSAGFAMEICGGAIWALRSKSRSLLRA